MKTLLTVLFKELRELSRDRKTLMLALLFSPLLGPILMIGMQQMGESKAKSEMEKPLAVAIVGAERAPNLVAWLAGQGIARKQVADPDAAIRSQDEDVYIRIDDKFDQNWKNGEPALVEVVSDSTRQDAAIPVARVRSALKLYGQQVGALRLLARGINPGVAAPLAVADKDLSLPEARKSLATFFIPYLLLISGFLGGAALVIDATAGERERQSLEPLLATPAPRSAVVSGKIAAACMIGLATLLLTLLAFKFSAQFAGTLGRQLNVSFLAIGKMLLILVPMLFIGTSLLTYLAASAKSMKEAQSHMTWLMLLPMIPTFALMANPLKSQPWQFAVPFLAQNQLLLKVIRNEYISAQTWGIYVAAAFGVAALLWYAAVRRYHQEKLAIAG